MAKEEDNCDYTGTVDFGEGPVKVKCTETGKHFNHKVEVVLGPGPQEREHSRHHNVFDKEDPDDY